MRWIAAAVAMALAGQARATIIDFNELANDQFLLDAGNPYISQGYQFLNTSSAGSIALFAWGRSGNALVYNADADPATGATLAHNQNQTVTTVSRLDGGTFTLTKLDIADVYNTGAPLGPVIFSFTTASGTTSETRFFDALRGLQTERFDLSGLLSFSIAPQQYQPPSSFSVGGYIQFDNVDVTGAVPEPATWAMMLIGFGGMGCMMRRRGKVAVRCS